MLLLAACATAPVAPAETPDEAHAVARTLDALHDAASRADGAAYFALFTPDAMFIGTDVSERWTLPEFRAYADPIFARGRGWTYRARSRSVRIAPVPCRCVAWFDEVLDSQSYGTTRGSGVLMRGPEGWKVAQYVLSFPVPNDLAKDMTDQIKAHEAKDQRPVQ
jgi:hypothetical protein